MKILLTGSAGFIGSNLINYLKKKNIDYTGIDKDYLPLITLYNQNLISCNLLDYQKFSNILKNRNIDYIIHLAAIGSIPKSLDDPSYTYDNNVVAFSNILKFAKLANVKKIIYASSSSVYGQNTLEIKRETMVGDVNNAYAHSKQINEKQADMFTKQTDISTTGFRFFNVYGPNQKVDHDYGAVIPRFINNMMNDKSCIIYGDGNQTRDFTYVDDICNAIYKELLMFSSKDNYTRIYNLGAGNAVSINKIYMYLSELFHNKKLECVYKEKRNETKHSQADIGLYKSISGWSPKTNIKDGLKLTVDHYINEGLISGKRKQRKT